jgi:Tol biopolymer transport system component
VKKQQITLLAVLAVAAALTVGCGDSKKTANDTPPTFSKATVLSNRDSNPVTPLFLMKLDGSSVAPVASPGDIYGASVSADGTIVSYTSDENVWVSNADGSVQTQLTTDNDTFYTRMSPDGSALLYNHWDEGSGDWSLWVANADGTGAVDLNTTLPDGITDCYNGNFSADSSKIVMTCAGPSFAGVYTTNPDGTGLATVLTQDSFVDTPSFSPDGSKILFVSFGISTGASHGPIKKLGSPRTMTHKHGVPGVPLTYGVVSANLDGSNQTVVVLGVYESEVLNSKLYFTSYDTDLGFNQVHQSDLDGSNEVSISDGSANDYLGLSAD